MTFVQKEGSGGGVEEPRWPYRTAGSGVGRGRRTWVRESGRNAAVSKLQVTSQTFPRKHQRLPGPSFPTHPHPAPRAHLSKEIIVMSENKEENMKVQTLTKYSKFLTRR